MLSRLVLDTQIPKSHGSHLRGQTVPFGLGLLPNPTARVSLKIPNKFFAKVAVFAGEAFSGRAEFIRPLRGFCVSVRD
jgi:hypothetical protein